ncbi:hypothetical protein [Curtobacterium sp. VKM Ac-2884]|uniref:hypothetical protein n=1 Tax=Curtobacterium sp. VKM Ac-2884 TaxID=2783818 RepID=UPI00188C5428|nr:hypothetical protein [Curtobacterium sp. VKM Ac-2884]MBF4604702.1 hypothetical protein [Curtobacterium sp. VKM Ac-2884]
MTDRPQDRRPVVRFRRSDLVIGPKFWWGCVVGAVLIILGVLVTPSNGWAGAGIGVAGILGATLGTLFQPAPRERDLTPNGTSAVRGLVHIAQDVENTKVLVRQLSEAAPKNVRLTVGLADAQDRLEAVLAAMYGAMAEWDTVAPGSLDEVSRLQDEGRRAFEMLAKEAERQEGAQHE